MKSFHYFILLCIYVLISVFLYIPSSYGLEKELKLNVSLQPPHLDFGVVEIGTVLEEAITVINEESEDITLLDIKKSCGCTDIDWVQTVIPPHSAYTFTIFVDTTEKMSGYQAAHLWLKFKKGTFEEIHDFEAVYEIVNSNNVQLSEADWKIFPKRINATPRIDEDYPIYRILTIWGEVGDLRLFTSHEFVKLGPILVEGTNKKIIPIQIIEPMIKNKNDISPTISIVNNEEEHQVPVFLENSPPLLPSSTPLLIGLSDSKETVKRVLVLRKWWQVKIVSASTNSSVLEVSIIDNETKSQNASLEIIFDQSEKNYKEELNKSNTILAIEYQIGEKEEIFTLNVPIVFY